MLEQIHEMIAELKLACAESEYIDGLKMCIKALKMANLDEGTRQLAIGEYEKALKATEKTEE